MIRYYHQTHLRLEIRQREVKLAPTMRLPVCVLVFIALSGATFTTGEKDSHVLSSYDPVKYHEDMSGRYTHQCNSGTNGMGSPSMSC